MQAQPSEILFQIPEAGIEVKDIILLHGLFGTLSNWYNVQKEFSKKYRVFIPELPLLDIYTGGNRLDKLVEYLDNYITENNISRPALVGNSLGGHIALLYTLKYPGKVNRLVLTGSSGLYEKSFGGSFPRIKDYRYIKSKVEEIFHKKEVVKRDVVNKVYSIVQSNSSVISVIGLAREAQRQNLAQQLSKINLPVLLIWGLQDTVTPPSVAHEFYERLPYARLCLINDCGHVPMMEQPELFNKHLNDFLEKHNAVS
ncbi:pimeloyl-ACP methyl ester carboxylesterase [Arcticibacter tournemirensis]|uniref:Alpha/beta hydrolase n=1 Tax=Arcticibacter tournemirensis TaxID=699437 RepID=A0A5M9H083_9SPHI|nr:alpha/beta hydrolase [Arcticibacter tournemirensis]KAA8478494.1 alpha/beta hydrolase [Arcticibacter tournemirensis]TQM51159.1 pimeloyl-ACP methyl ester carboxylesterase [Arcticibacter tournemirensis]